jgi:hypothetical protein
VIGCDEVFLPRVGQIGRQRVGRERIAPVFLELPLLLINDFSIRAEMELASGGCCRR